MTHYVAIVEEAGPDTAVGVWIPDLPGCFSEALHNAAAAVTLYAEELAKTGRRLPDPRSVADIRSDPTVAADIRDHMIALVSPSVDEVHAAE